MNKNLRAVLLGYCLLMFIGQLSAQNKPDKKDKAEMEAKINELRKQYFNEKLALSATEQKAFWPLFDEHKQKDKSLRDSFNNRYKKNEVVFMDDKKSEEYLNAMLKLKDDQNNLYKEYINKYRKVLPIKKVAMLPMLEREFKQEMMKKMMHQKNGKKEGPPPPSED